MLLLVVAVRSGTIKPDIHCHAESRSNSGGVEVAGSNPVSPTSLNAENLSISGIEVQTCGKS